MGELGFLTPDNRRTATVRCTEAGQVLTITYEKLLELYFQNPQFGYYFLVLTSQRLLQNIARLEGVIASAPDKAALMRPIEAHDGDAVASAQREAPSTMRIVIWFTGRADFAGSHRATPGRSACERCQSRQTFFRVVWSCRILFRCRSSTSRPSAESKFKCYTAFRRSTACRFLEIEAKRWYSVSLDR